MASKKGQKLNRNIGIPPIQSLWNVFSAEDEAFNFLDSHHVFDFSRGICKECNIGEMKTFHKNDNKYMIFIRYYSNRLDHLKNKLLKSYKIREDDIYKINIGKENYDIIINNINNNLKEETSRDT